jgi:hypothetical protein
MEARATTMKFCAIMMAIGGLQKEAACPEPKGVVVEAHRSPATIVLNPKVLVIESGL